MNIEALSAGNVRAWCDLFARASSPCFCRYWHFGGPKSEWLARCAIEAEVNRDEAQAGVQACTEDSLGLVALEGAEAIGWLKLAPRASVPKLRGLPVYRSLDLGPAKGVWSVGCVLVDPGYRRRGVAGALLDAAPAFVRARGGRRLEAYPKHVHKTEGPHLHDEEAMMGPESLFLSRGFRAAAGTCPTPMYPVLQLEIEEREPRPSHLRD